MTSLCRVMCANVFSDSYYTRGGDICSMQESVDDLEKALSLYAQELPIVADLGKHFGGYSKWLLGRSLFLTIDGKVGLGPDYIQEKDNVVVLLGCSTPMVLRPNHAGSYRVVGEAYLDGVVDVEALLGSLPDHVSATWYTNSSDNGIYRKYIDCRTNEILDQDPRLGPPPAGWKMVKQADEPWHTLFVDDKGQYTKSDPRLKSDVLLDRGVELEVFELV
jgi:hypothetical protein